MTEMPERQSPIDTPTEDAASVGKTGTADGGAPEAGVMPAASVRPESAAAATEKPAKDDDPLAILRGKTVLLTEDNMQIRKLVMQRLKFHGVLVEVAEDGLLAWQKLTAEPPLKPDLMLLDMMMPQMNGLELLGRIRQNDALKHIPVFIMSARRDRKLVILLMKLGIQGYVVKPLKLGETLMRIAEVLRGNPCAVL